MRLRVRACAPLSPASLRQAGGGCAAARLNIIIKYYQILSILKYQSAADAGGGGAPARLDITIKYH